MTDDSNIINELLDEIARLKAELEMETDAADGWSRKATALQAVADAARQAQNRFLPAPCGDPACSRCAEVHALRDALEYLDQLAQADADG